MVNYLLLAAAGVLAFAVKTVVELRAERVKNSAEAKDGAATEESAKGDEASWHLRMDTAREALRQAEAFHEALQSQINALTADFTSRDDPAQRAVIADSRQKALEQLDKTAADIVKAKQGIVDVEEAARRASGPPGWIR